jgi:hypothetical protein
MKFTKFISIVLAIVFCIGMLAACGGENDGTGEPSDENAPVTALEKLTYAYDYALENPYKQHVLSTSSSTDQEGIDPVESETVHFIDGENYYTELDGVVQTYHNGIIYVNSELLGSKKKLAVSDDDYGQIVDQVNKMANEAINGLTEDDITMSKTKDGYVLEYTVKITYVYEFTFRYVTTLDKNNRMIGSTVTTETAYGFNYVDVITYEYGEQYKVNAPSDADEYELVDSYLDLFRS